MRELLGHNAAMPESPRPTIETIESPARAAEVAFVAATTFPLACPTHSTREDISAHIAKSLSPQRFSYWISNPGYDVLVARECVDGPMIGYTLLIHDAPTDDDVRAVVPGGEVTEISKMYVLPQHHGSRGAERPARRLMEAALDTARRHGSTTAWLGVNQLNARAQRFYAAMGFDRVGTKSFDMNGTVEHDYVMTRKL